MCPFHLTPVCTGAAHTVLTPVVVELTFNSQLDDRDSAEQK